MATSPVTLVASPEGIAELAERLSRVPTLAVDLESNGLFAFTATLCTLQLLDLARPDEVIVVDPVKLPDAALAPLAAILGEQGPKKLIHDVSFDARILAQHGLPLANVFDTALAARFLGVQATGLGSMAEARLGVKLSKKMQHHNWGKRPLNAEALVYLAADVQVMPPLAAQLEKEVDEKGIRAELDEEIRFRLASANADAGIADPRPPYVRIKDADKLKAPELAILREVAAVRDESAKRLDVPPFKVLDNATLIALAQKPPTSKAELAQLRGLQHARAASLHERLWDAVERGRNAKDIPADERLAHFTPAPKPPRDVLTAMRQREQRLMAWRKAEAARRKIDEQAVLPGHVLRRLADKGPTTPEALAEIPGLGAVRATRDAAAILAAVTGKPA